MGGQHYASARKQGVNREVLARLRLAAFGSPKVKTPEEQAEAAAISEGIRAANRRMRSGW